MDRNLNVGVGVGLCLHRMYSDAVYSRSLTLKTMVTSVELCTVIPVSVSLNHFHSLELEKEVFMFYSFECESPEYLLCFLLF